MCLIYNLFVMAYIEGVFHYLSLEIRFAFSSLQLTHTEVIRAEMQISSHITKHTHRAKGSHFAMPTTDHYNLYIRVYIRVHVNKSPPWAKFLFRLN